MPIPDSWNQVPVTGAYVRQDGSFPQGYVVFETTQQGIVIEGILYSPGTIRVKLVGGAIPDGFTLPSTDDVDLNITGWTYKVTEQFLGGRGPFNIFIPHDSTGEDLNTIVPVAPPPEMQSALSAAVIAAAQGFAVRAENAALAAEGSEQDASNAAASEATATAAATTATGAASSATASALAASTSASQAGASATLAGTSAGTATTAAGAAGTSAAVATSGAASVSAIAAQFGDVDGAITAAEAARDTAQGHAITATASATAADTSADEAAASAAAAAASMATGGIYLNTAAGLAATTTGQYFSVPGADANDYLILYRNNAGSAVEVKRYPSTNAVDMLVTSTKNLYTGTPLQSSLANTVVGSSGDPLRRTTGFIPVVYGQAYTISGLDTTFVGSSSNRRVLGTATANIGAAAVKMFPVWSGSTYTVTIDDPAIAYLIVQIARDAGTPEQIAAMRLQVEQGATATSYEPYQYRPRMKAVQDAAIAGDAATLASALTADAATLASALDADAATLASALDADAATLASANAYTDSKLSSLPSGGPTTSRIIEFTDMQAVNSSFPILQLGSFTKGIGPFGVRYDMVGDSVKEAVGGNLYAYDKSTPAGTKSLYAEVACVVSGAPVAAKQSNVLFTVPSGMLDNPSTLPGYPVAYPTFDYTHPSIAYDAAGVAGYKYWMVASILPAIGGEATWEDEDVFVANDASGPWLRVRSLYETDKSYTTATLRLPPNDWATGARRHGLLPVPATGQTIEISSPAHNGNPEVDRQTVTLTGLPFKHDPAILIDGGYVHVYHSFHIPYGGSGNGTHRFMVCTRTSDGTNWEAVRSDGSTLALDSEAAVRTLFTKDGSGRYNFINYAYNTGRSNPEVIKYGPGDYELVYGLNFGQRFKGTTPYNFDFNTPYPIQDTGAGNHPGLLYSGGTLYLINNNAFYSSTDRGVTFTQQAHYPAWVGGATNIPYKKAMCIGEGGKVVLAHVKRNSNLAYAAQSEGQYIQTNRSHALFITQYASLAAFTGFATGAGLVDGYIDVQVEQINRVAGTRKSRLYTYVGPTNNGYGVNSPLQKVKVCDLTIAEGDEFHFFVSATARNGATIRFNGLEIG